MPPPPPIQFAGANYHLVTRGSVAGGRLGFRFSFSLPVAIRRVQFADGRAPIVPRVDWLVAPN